MATARERLLLLVATRKGAFMLRTGPARGRFNVEGPHFLGHIVHHAVLDPRDRRTLLAAARTGHLGPTVFRSTDFGASWQEAAQPLEGDLDDVALRERAADAVAAADLVGEVGHARGPCRRPRGVDQRRERVRQNAVVARRHAESVLDRGANRGAPSVVECRRTGIGLCVRLQRDTG
jgi:hypothetical protein